MVKLAKKFKMVLMTKTTTLSPPPGHSVSKANQKEEHNVDIDDGDDALLVVETNQKKPPVWRCTRL